MKGKWIVAGIILAQAVVPAQSKPPQNSQEVHRLHQDSKAYIAFLEDPKRDAYQKPMEVITALGLKEGEVIADIGAGSGYFTFRFAHHVGEKGRVFAVDVSPDMILFMNRRIRDLKLKNVTTILAAPDDPFLADASVDRIFICEVWHHIENQQSYLALLKRMLKPGGQVIMVDFQKRELPIGPPVSMKIAREDLLRQMESAGFYLVREHSFLPYQYFLVFEVRPN
jgi:cyclopropane fatty-acyl-phospholipid synthase-like methyltransferase